MNITTDPARRFPRALTVLVALALCCAAVLLSCPAATAAARGGHTAVAGRRLVFTADFAEQGQWGWQSGAYSHCVTNPHQHKLDDLTRAALSAHHGALTITARPGPDGLWNTGLVTTGDSCSTGGSGFQERTGDLVVAHVQMPGPTAGAWPGVWSWRAGGNEVDLFEWHAGAAHRLEFVNHSCRTGELWTSPRVAPGAQLWIGTHLGARRVTWYVGTSLAGMRPVWHDACGVGPRFAAYPVINLSVDDGSNYPRPNRSGRLRFILGTFQVYR